MLASRRLSSLSPRYASSSTFFTGSDASSSHDDDDDSIVRRLPPQFLRDSCRDNYSPSTHQRADVQCDAADGRPRRNGGVDHGDNSRYRIRRCDFRGGGGGGSYEITWSDGASTAHSRRWIEEQLESWERTGGPGPIDEKAPKSMEERVPWSGLSESDIRSPSSGMSLAFDDAVLGDGGADEAVRALYAYGLILVTGTPTEDGGEGVAALAAAVSGGTDKSDPDSSLLARYREKRAGRGGSHDGDGGPVERGVTTFLPNGTDGPLRTLYGTVWSTSTTGMAPGTSTADSAYGTGALPLHTDMTYLGNPPGLQIFTMKCPAGRGGDSVFGDGFAAAKRLKDTDPAAFDTLCRTVRRYRSVDDEEGWHLEATGPVLRAADRGPEMDPRWGPVGAVRHNDLDRMPDLPPAFVCSMMGGNEREGAIRDFYSELTRAHDAWDDILGSDDIRLLMALRPGDTVAVANQRCFHGRTSFVTDIGSPRAVMGCYVSQDDLDSRFRRAGFHVY